MFLSNIKVNASELDFNNATEITSSDNILYIDGVEAEKKYSLYYLSNGNYKLTQDIIIERDDWLVNLTKCIQAGECEASYSRQTCSNNTIENIKYTAALFRNLQRPNNIGAINKVMIVTSSFHCRRAMLAFKKYFRNIEICSCPSTLDFKDKGITFCKADMLGHEYYRRQIENELDAIINYTRKGSIEDCDISLVVGEEMAKEIERRQIEVEF